MTSGSAPPQAPFALSGVPPMSALLDCRFRGGGGTLPIWSQAVQGESKRASRECSSPAAHPRMMRGVRQAGDLASSRLAPRMLLHNRNATLDTLSCIIYAAADARSAPPRWWRSALASASTQIGLGSRVVCRCRACEHAWLCGAMVRADPSRCKVPCLLARRESAMGFPAAECLKARQLPSRSSTN